MGSTTVDGFPYPVGTDRVMDGDNAIQALAEALTGRTVRVASGVGSITGAANVVRSLAITFPAGRFTAPPIVLVVIRGGASTGTPPFSVWCAASPVVTTAGATLQGSSTSANAIPVEWVAVQALP